MQRRLPVLLGILLVLFCSQSTGKPGTYKIGDPVIIYVNKIGPYYNPHETYDYLTLPFCIPNILKSKILSLGEVLDGDRLHESSYNVSFMKTVHDREICTKFLKQSDVLMLISAVENLYYFEFVIDDIPVREFVGVLEEKGFLPHEHKVQLYTHLSFQFEYNDNHVISVYINSGESATQDLESVRSDGGFVRFSYSVNWKKVDVPVDRRSAHNYSFFAIPTATYWLSIIYSTVVVTLLVIIVCFTLLRTINKELEDDDSVDYGWKLLYANVFRPPKHLALLSCFSGVGIQLLIVCVLLICMGLLQLFNVRNHGFLNTSFVIVYAVTSCIAGLVASRVYKQLGGQNWVHCIHITSAAFFGPAFIIWSIVNTLSWTYGSTQALPLTTILLLLTLWLLVGLPLNLLGGIVGRNTAPAYRAPCRTRQLAREIPIQHFYKTPLFECLLGGLAIFSASSLEIYYFYVSIWGRQQSTTYAAALLVLFIVISVAGCVSVVFTYYHLSGEDYRWWWRSTLPALGNAIFVFCYSFLYFLRSNMHGLLQTAQFFLCSLLISYIAFLALAAVSFFCCFSFVHRLYSNIKVE